MKKQTIFAMIPARIGSTRLKVKNLALLDGKPLIYYAINAARESGVFDRIIINSDSAIFNQIAERYDVEFYHRPAELGRSETKSDEVVADFLKNNTCDVVAWVNPIAPLQTGAEINSIVEYFLDHNLDTLHTVKKEQVHCNYNNNPINYTFDEIFDRTQELEPLQPFVYTVMIWHTDQFLESYSKNGYAFFCSKVGFYTVDKISGTIIKDNNDLLLAECLMQQLGIQGMNAYRVKYDPLAGM